MRHLAATRSRVLLAVATVTAVGLAAALTPVPQSEAAPVEAKRVTYRIATPGPAALPTTNIGAWPKRIVIGKSARGRAIVAQRLGNPNAEKVALAIGVIHGNEPVGAKIIDRLVRAPIAQDASYQLWVIRAMNPDGLATGKRHTARGVDLNRNFPYGWSRHTYAAGRGPGSEPETRTLVNFMDRLRPDSTLIFHQNWNVILGTCNPKTRPFAYRFAKLSGIPPERCGRAYTGTMGSWYNYLYPGYSLTVELPSTHRVNAKRLARFTNAVLATARETPDLDQTPPAPAPSPEVSPSS